MSGNQIGVDQFRPIGILTVLHKLYMRCLYILIKVHWQLKGWIQLGARSGHKALELIHVIRLVIEKATEWDRSFCIIVLDFICVALVLLVCSLLSEAEIADELALAVPLKFVRVGFLPFSNWGVPDKPRTAHAVRFLESVKFAKI